MKLEGKKKTCFPISNIVNAAFYGPISNQQFASAISRIQYSTYSNRIILY